MRGVIFDNDGVLVDSEKLSCGAWLPVLARHGVRVELEEIERFIGKSGRAVLEWVNQAHGTSLGDEVAEEKVREYIASARGRLRAFPGLREALEGLRRRGLGLAVASSGTLEVIRFALSEAGLGSLFSVICSASEVERGKPAPDLFLLAARRLGLAPEECAVVEDSVFGIAGAKAAGMRAIAFTSSTPPEALRAAGADQVFGDYAALGAMIPGPGEGWGR